jgi:hypothetical protein
MVTRSPGAVPACSLKPLDSLRIETSDPRSDNRRRIVDVARESVTIRRAVAGISMAIKLTPSAYRGVALRVAANEEGRFLYEVRLVHRDPDLSVLLTESEDEGRIESEWRAWVRFLRLPALVGWTESGDIELNIATTALALRRPSPRRRGRAAALRRPRFLMRRKLGAGPRGAPVDADPLVLFFGSKLGR